LVKETNHGFGGGLPIAVLTKPETLPVNLPKYTLASLRAVLTKYFAHAVFVLVRKCFDLSSKHLQSEWARLCEIVEVLSDETILLDVLSLY